MPEIQRGRFMADTGQLQDGEVVVFLIGFAGQQAMEDPGVVAGLRRHAEDAAPPREAS